MYTLLEKAKLADEKIFEQLGDQTFSISKARLYSVEVEDDGQLHAVVQCEHGDVYDMLESIDALHIATKSKNILLVTCGWAAPRPQDGNDDDEVAPSQHPERRRVMLSVIIGDDGIASTIRFADSDETVVDEGNATGSLAEAINKLWLDSRTSSPNWL
jgi:hypothetical protein